MIIQSHIQQMKDATWDGYNPKFNCWGATQYALGQRKRWGWVGAEVMWRWINTKTTPVEGELQEGDVLVISCATYNKLIHTAVYMGNGKWFHKRGRHDTLIQSQQEVEDCYVNDRYFYGDMKAKVSIHRLKLKKSKTK